MNPKPLLALNHLTVPCSFNCVSLFCLSYLVLFPTASRQKKRGCKCGLAAPSRFQRFYKSNKRTAMFSCLSRDVHSILRVTSSPSGDPRLWQTAKHSLLL